MNLDVPILSAEDVRDELRTIHQKRHRTRTTAMYGRGPAGEVQVDIDGGTQTFRVAPVSCELELRRALEERGDAPLALLVSFGCDRLPVDLQGRLARGHVYATSPSRRLARRFRVSAVSSEVLACRPLRDALLAADLPEGARSAGSTLDTSTAWRILLEHRARWPAGITPAETSVLDFCATSTAGEAFAVWCSAQSGLRQPLLAHLERVAGRIAALAWQAWERGEGRKVAVAALLLDAVRERWSTDARLLRAQLKPILAQAFSDEGAAVAADDALRGRCADWAKALALRAEEPAVVALLHEADRVVAKDADLREFVRDGTSLTAAYEHACEELAEALRAGRIRGDAAALAAARGPLSRMERHRLARTGDGPERVRRARMAVRLLAWSVERNARTVPPGPGRPWEDMQRVAVEYVRSGAWVDRARDLARGSDTTSLDEAVTAWADHADALRDDDDRRFAYGLPAWLEGGRRSDELIPIDAALDKLAVGFLEKGKHRKLAVVLLDGMSWPAALELLEDLERSHFAPVRWRPKEWPAAGLLLPPVLASLPTITEVSRAAFFSGRPPVAGESGNTARDPERFAEHKGLSKIDVHAPRLLLKNRVEATSGHLSEEAGQLLACADRVVALVVNAIDDQLKSGRQIRTHYTLDSIKPLGEILRRSTEAGRAVLLVADHGHVAGTRFDGTVAGGPDARPRWRPLAADDVAHPHEIELRAPHHVGCPRGHSRIATLWHEAHTYVPSSRLGEHGGASLAEVVAPAVLIASEQLARQLENEAAPDRDLEVIPYPRPGWWDLEVVAARAVAPVPRPRKEKVPSPQLELIAAPEPRTGPTTNGATAAAPPSRWASLLGNAPQFRALASAEREVLHAQIVPAIEVLVEHNGTCARDVFARRTGRMASRVEGFVSVLAEWLNFEGYAVVAYESADDTVRLDLALLESIYGETP